MDKNGLAGRVGGLDVQIEAWKGYFPRIDGFQTCKTARCSDGSASRSSDSYPWRYQ